MGAFRLAVECSLVTNQLVHCDGELTNEKEAEKQAHQTIFASHETERQEPYVPFKGKGFLEDDRPSYISKIGASSHVPEIRGSLSAYVK